MSPATHVNPVDLDHAIALFADGWNIYRAHDMDGEPERVTCLSQFRGYTADQLVALQGDDE